MDPRGGTEFVENGPNLTEDIFWALATTLVGSEGPEAVQISGIELNTGERSDIISSWHREAVKHALAKANNGNTDQGPVLKVRDSVDQSIVRWYFIAIAGRRPSGLMGGVSLQEARDPELNHQ